jgi:predicted nucleic acid-binding protein
MTLIVCDTGPIRYLIEVEAIDLLVRLYGRVMTTPQVLVELQATNFPDVVKKWASNPPVWLDVQATSWLQFADVLDLGEASALSLALEVKADLILLDERMATKVAIEHGLVTAGTLAVLRDAGVAGLINFREVIRRLTEQTRFRHSKGLIERLLDDFDRAKQ